jgi:hypothetical protein
VAVAMAMAMAMGCARPRMHAMHSAIGQEWRCLALCQIAQPLPVGHHLPTRFLCSACARGCVRLPWRLLAFSLACTASCRAVLRYAAQRPNLSRRPASAGARRVLPRTCSLPAAWPAAWTGRSSWTRPPRRWLRQRLPARPRARRLREARSRTRQRMPLWLRTVRRMALGGGTPCCRP